MINETPRSAFLGCFEDRLRRNMFYKSEGVYWKDFTRRARGQIVLSSNNFFVSILCQVSFPHAAEEIARALSGRRLSKVSAGGVYNPVLSCDIVGIVKDPYLRGYIERADWATLLAYCDIIVNRIIESISDAVEWRLEEDSPWWPDEFSDLQRLILISELTAIKRIDVLGTFRKRYGGTSAG